MRIWIIPLIVLLAGCTESQSPGAHGEPAAPGVEGPEVSDAAEPEDPEPPTPPANATVLPKLLYIAADERLTEAAPPTGSAQASRAALPVVDASAGRLYWDYLMQGNGTFASVEVSFTIEVGDHLRAPSQGEAAIQYSDHVGGFSTSWDFPGSGVHEVSVSLPMPAIEASRSWSSGESVTLVLSAPTDVDGDSHWSILWGPEHVSQVVLAYV